ncbi:hypothetical protein CCACVL1_28271 [Corchorus capsularis]|uniref:Uncharacterized protein n=1 Tax=Corchorus capsularis TaxID=210143 RepID=A0A1R3G719_COCAP|nr:hypothetical protein CCACVL1_28271 [Corchorus capsularis]
MREKFGFLLCVLILLWGTCLGKFIVEKNSLKLTSPESIKGVYDCAIGSFGVPQYARILIGTVIYPKANQRSCRNFDDYGISFKSKPGELPTILLVDRGDCFLSLKVSYAQKAGAAAVLIADYLDEPLITMYTPEDDDVEYLQELNITIPSAFIRKSLGDSIKKALQSGEMVNIGDQIKYEFWTNSNYECGPNCDNQLEFVKKFKGTAKILEQKGYTQFTPHYKTWYCPKAFTLTKRCKSQCINHGRYCAPDPEQDFTKGYDGKDVLIQNLRHACLFKVAREYGKPWLWWDYVTDFAIRCPMRKGKYNKYCADQVIRSLGIDITKIEKCIGDPDADVENPVLKAELEAQMGNGYHAEVTRLPTLLINNSQYKGELQRGAVLKAICGGFQDPMRSICLSQGLEYYDNKDGASSGRTRLLKLLHDGYDSYKKFLQMILSKFNQTSDALRQLPQIEE